MKFKYCNVFGIISQEDINEGKTNLVYKYYEVVDMLNAAFDRGFQMALIFMEAQHDES